MSLTTEVVQLEQSYNIELIFSLNDDISVPAQCSPLTFRNQEPETLYDLHFQAN